ncbi:MAG TPA: ComEC/Rec2 family competence protein [Candidatus Helicobacter avistercoris]|nr:ComEC/Rec2 family competence protein [Candidatus Helicobacter avistercoris]
MNLFQTRREWLVFGGVCLFLFGLMLLWRFYVFQTYIHSQNLTAKVLAQYIKGDKWVLKLRTIEGQILYTTSREDLRDLTYRDVSLYGKSASCDFLQSLKSCFFITYSLSLLPKTSTPFLSWVQSQHTNPLIAKMYQSLFFATYLPKEYRDLSSALHISHLFAISGLHLGIIACILYFLIGKPYGYFQARYFTYRNRYFDIGLIVILTLFVYAWILDFPPAFVRAFVMSAVGLVFVWSHIKLLSFAFLLLCVGVILGLFPQFLLNFGFWFSVCGVYFILLFFKYFYTQSKGIIKAVYTAFVLNVCLFFQMLPLSHCIFPSFSPYCILAIALSWIFPVFFILALLAHFLGVGWVFDGVLEWAMGLDMRVWSFYTPLPFALLFTLFSILALRYRWSYYLTLGLGGVFYVFLVVKMLR